jgi:4-hydroxybenzoate polyprenyltransferase
MLVWSRLGCLGFLIVAGVLIGALYLAEALGGRTAVEEHPWVLAVSWLLSSALCWVVGRRLNRDYGHQVLDIHFTGHSTMGVRLEYAGLILGGIVHLFVAFMVLVKTGKLDRWLL